MSFGPFELILILAVVLILFGAGKLPKVMGDIGRGVKELKKGLSSDTKTETLENKSDKDA